MSRFEPKWGIGGCRGEIDLAGQGWQGL